MSDGEYGWFAFPPEGYRRDEDDRWEEPPEGSQIRFMSEESVDVPLWGEGGLMFADGEELVREWGVSQRLADDVVRWGRASQGLPSPELHAEAARLVQALDEHTGHRFRFVYRP